MTSRAGRAAPLPADERRLAIIAATIPLLCDHGRAVATRQIAQAAGIAEGTIFRVFPDKDSLVDAALLAVMDPTPSRAALRAIDRATPIEHRVRAVIDILTQRLASVGPLLSTIAGSASPEIRKHFGRRRRPPMSEFVADIAALFDVERDCLSTSAESAARLLRALVFGAAHPMLADENSLDTDEIVRMFLHGILTSGAHHSGQPPATKGKPC